MSIFQLVAVVLGFYVAFHFSNQIALLFVSSNDGVVVPLLAFVLVLGSWFCDFLLKIFDSVKHQILYKVPENIPKEQFSKLALEQKCAGAPFQNRKGLPVTA